MKRFICISAVMALVTAFVFANAAYAGKGGNGNGFLEGPHFNLNLIGKKSDLSAGGYYKCPSPENYQFVWWKDADGDDGGDCAVTEGVANQWCTSCNPDVDGVVGPDDGICIKGEAKGRNVIHVPRDNDTDNNSEPDRDISMVMTSGSSGSVKGGRKKSLTGDQSEWCTTAGGCLGVTDWCTQHFPNDGTTPASLETAGGDGAAFTLPANDFGYRVLARVMGRPVEGDAFQFLQPSITDLRDEFGNTLFDDEGYSYLDFGTINPDGSCTDANGDDNPDCILKRSDSGPGKKGKKGVQKATELSALFQFSGDICYVNDTSCQYCYQIVGSENELENGQFCDPNDSSTWLGGANCAYTCTTSFSNVIGYAGAGVVPPDFVCCFAYNENSDPEGDGSYYVDKDGRLCDPDTTPQCVMAGEEDSCGDPANYDCRIDSAAYADQYVCSGDNTPCQEAADCGSVCSNDDTIPCTTGGLTDCGDASATCQAQTCEFDQTVCAEGNEITPACRSYDDIWVFNVADFVNVLMKMKTGGAYIVQLRFYPVQ